MISYPFNRNKDNSLINKNPFINKRNIIYGKPQS